MDGAGLLQKCYRLRKNKDFQAVYKKKNSVAAKTVVLYIRKQEDSGLLRVGFSVSKRIGNAVVRNRCRRLLREAVRMTLAELRTGRDYVFIARAPITQAKYETIVKDVKYVLKRKDCLR